MRKNIYTETIDSIRVSETTLRKALEAVGKTDKGDITMTKNKKLKFTGMVAASLAVVIAGGTAAGYLPGSGKADVTEKTAASSSGKTSSTNSFTLMVNAAELTEEPMIISSSGNPAVNSAEIKANKIRGISLSEGDDEGGYSVSYNVPLEISCEGENISSVTYSVDTGAVSVAYYMGEDPVKAGTETNRCDNTMEGTVPLKPEYQKMRDELIKEIPSDGDGDAEVEWSDEELEKWRQIDKSYENSTFKHYSSITIAPDDPSLDYSSFALVGSSKELSMDKRNYLEAHSGATQSQVSQATGVSMETIRYFLKEERLEVTSSSNIMLSCEICNAPIRSGRYCEACSKKLRLKSEAEKSASHKSNISGYGKTMKGESGARRFIR